MEIGCGKFWFETPGLRGGGRRAAGVANGRGGTGDGRALSGCERCVDAAVFFFKQKTAYEVWL